MMNLCKKGGEGGMRGDINSKKGTGGVRGKDMKRTGHTI